MSYPTKLMFVAGALVFGIVAGTSLADTGIGDKFWQWRDAQGIAFTDDEKRIPETYRDQAIRRDFEDMLEKRTEMIISEKDQLELLNRQLKALKYHLPRRTSFTCGRPYITTKERRDHKVDGQSLNSLFYVIKDSCGEELGAFLEKPEVYMELK